LHAELEAIAAEVPTTPWHGQLALLIESIRQDTSAEEILSNYPAWVPLLVSGTESESKVNLADSLEQAADHRQVRSRAWRSLLYPLMILSLAFAVLLLISWLIVPEFSAMYKEFQLSLPAPTALLLMFSDQLIEFPVGVFAVAALIVAGFAALLWAWGRHKLSYRIFERIPARERADSLACLTSNLASLLDGGAALNEALDVVARGDLHPHYQTAAKTLGYYAASHSMPPDDLLPPNLIYALGIGRHASPNIRFLQEQARSYRQRGHEQNDGWQGFVATSSIIAVGVVVGWIVIALFLPLISLITGLS
jgi:type II secretory pathway component PulF